MENWKVEFVEDRIATAGDNGRVSFYDLISKEKVKKVDMGEVFLTALTKSNERPFLAGGNNNGDVYIVNSSGSKELTVALKPHNKLVRQVAFARDDTKLLTASDDSTVQVIDIASEKVAQSHQGHKLAVSSVEPHQLDQNTFFSTSFDKSIKVWDLRTQAAVGGAVTGGALWDCRSVGKHVLAGG
jgi:WD40 repeat protein